MRLIIFRLVLDKRIVIGRLLEEHFLSFHLEVRHEKGRDFRDIYGKIEAAAGNARGIVFARR